MFSNIIAGAAGFPVADLGEQITHGLRFRNDPGVPAQYLYNTSLAGYQLSNYTISVWVKRGNFTDGSARYILTSGDTTTGTGGGNNPNKLSFNHDGSTPGFVFKDGGGDTHSSTQPLHRDYSAWYHVVAQRDQSAGTVKLFINGYEIGSASATASPGLFNQSGDNAVLIGLYADPDYGSTGWNGYMAEFNFLESKLEPTDFGRTNEDGVWVPKNLSGLTSAQYGAKGFRLKFDLSAGLGDDSAPTGTGHSSANDFTAVGFNTTAISSSNTDNDVSYLDTPTSNYATLNAASPNYHTGALIDANLAATSSSVGASPNAPATIRNITSGDWYFEFEANNGNLTFGIAADDTTFPIGDPRGMGTDSIWFGANYVWSGRSGSYTFTPGVTFSAPWINGIRINIDAGEITFYGYNTTLATKTFAQINTDLQVNFANKPLSFFINPILSTTKVNWGQRPFIYRPSGFTNNGNLELNNLPEPTIKNGKKYFDILTWTGDGASPKTRTGLEFTPDLVWIKERNQAFSIGHRLYDSVRGAGVNKHLNSSSVAAEGSGNDEDYGYVTGFVDGGFTAQAGTVGDDYVNDTSTNYVAWCWKAGGTAVSNSNGSITSSVSANTDAGFSIVSYTGTGSNATVGHGLDSAPEMIIFKNRDSNAFWAVYHKDIASPTTQYLVLQASDNNQVNAGILNSTAPGSSVFNIGTSNASNGNNEDMIAYCWHSVEGYSKFGTYTGNGSTNGPFVYLGFKPSLIICKGSSHSGSWTIVDSTRDLHNPSGKSLSSDVSNVESGPDQYSYVDFLANGFKWRTNQASRNSSGVTYVYMAFAENPFGGENAAPTTAR